MIIFAFQTCIMSKKFKDKQTVKVEIVWLVHKKKPTGLISYRVENKEYIKRAIDSGYREATMEEIQAKTGKLVEIEDAAEENGAGFIPHADVQLEHNGIDTIED
jgi:hypothetical protein